MVSSAMKEKKTRYSYIDIAKALGMLAVMWGHLMLGGRTNSFVYAFHIPLFFFLSGMMFKKNIRFRDFFFRRVRTLLLPYAVFSVLTWVYWVVRNLVLGLPMNSVFMPLLQTVLAQGSGGFLIHNVALWFVPCLFVVEMLYYWLAKLPDWARAAACIVCGALGYWMIRPNAWFDFKLLPWSIEVATTAMVFYGAGHFLIEKISHERLIAAVNRKKWCSFAVSLLLFAVIFVFAPTNGHISVAQGSLGDNIFVFYLLAFCGIGAALLLSVLLSNFGVSYLVWFGESSFYAMAIHVPVMVDMIWLWAKIRHIDINGLRYNYFATIPIYIAMVAVTSLWICVVKKVRKNRKDVLWQRK